MGKIWTSSAFTLLYEELTKQFPYHTWKKVASPGDGRDEKYREFCEMFARVVKPRVGKRWISKSSTRYDLYRETLQKMKPDRRQHVLRNYHVNKCYALQAGFIKHT